MLLVLRQKALVGASRGFLRIQGFTVALVPSDFFTGGSCGQLGDIRGFLVSWKLMHVVGIAWGSWDLEVLGVR